MRDLNFATLRPFFAPFAVKGLISPESFKTLNRKVRKEIRKERKEGAKRAESNHCPEKGAVDT